MRERHNPSQRAKELEKTMARVRAFGIVLGIYQVFWYEPNPGTLVPPSVYAIAGAALGLLATENLAVLLTLRRPRAESTFRRLGAIVFAADVAAVWTIVWAFNFEQFGATWVILSVVCLEGALRYQLRGAMIPVLLSLPVEIAREFARHHDFGFPSYASSVSFRIGFMAMIAAVAGAMAHNLERERTEAVSRAKENEELARREVSARRESNAFQEVILAGVTATEPVEALQIMLEHVANDLGYEHSAVLLIGEDGRLHPVAAHGFPSDVFTRSVAIGEGIAGDVVRSGRAEIIGDVSDDPRYVRVDPSTRSQVTVPIRLATEIVGAIDVESPTVDAFGAADAGRLERLGAQMALVLEKTRLLQQERAAVERLRELDLMKSDFIAIASHELRTPLTSMQGSIKTLRRDDISLSDDETSQLLAVLDRQSDRLTRLVEDLLLASRIDAGGVSLRFESVDVSELCRELVRELGARADRVSVALPTDLPRILTDGQRVYQIARNLIENALKFSTDHSVVRLTVHGDGERLQLEVADSGPGISPADLPHIFDRFHQIGGALRRRADGFGLGLYITKRLVEALRGDIEVESTVGRGTTFRVRFPFQRAEISAVESA